MKIKNLVLVNNNLGGRKKFFEEGLSKLYPFIDFVSELGTRITNNHKV